MRVQTIEEKRAIVDCVITVRAQRKVIRRLKRAVALAEKQFRFYAEIHARKGTSEGFHKADQNRQMANKMKKALDI